jgi:hypothetical protein
MNTITALTSVLVLAALAEALVEYLFSPIIKAQEPNAPALRAREMEPEPAANLDWRALTLRYTAALVGVLLCIVYQADLLLLFNLNPPWPWVGYLITGLLIGRGSNFVHDFAARWLNSD